MHLVWAMGLVSKGERLDMIGGDSEDSPRASRHAKSAFF